MSIYIGNTKISGIFPVHTGINTVKNVLELGVIKDVNTEETSINLSRYELAI